MDMNRLVESQYVFKQKPLERTVLKQYVLRHNLGDVVHGKGECQIGGQRPRDEGPACTGTVITSIAHCIISEEGSSAEMLTLRSTGMSVELAEKLLASVTELVV